VFDEIGRSFAAGDGRWSDGLTRQVVP